MRPLRILYAGSPLASGIVLKNLAERGKKNGYEISAVLTNPPSSRGRHKELIPTEVARTAQSLGIPVFAFDHLTSEARAVLSPLGCDLLVCFDFGRIFGEKFLSMFPLGGINLHPSALPKYRGCTPVPAAILNGDRELGISVQKLALKTDEGDILARTTVALDGTETTKSLMDGDGSRSVVIDEGTALLDGVLRSIVAAADNPCNERPFVMPQGTPQSGEASYTGFFKKEDGRIDWHQSAECIERKIRAYTPFPLCFTVRDGTNLLILTARVGAEKTDAPAGTVLPYRKSVGVEIACGGGSVLVVTELQWQAKKAMDYASFMNGARGIVGSVLG
ncbi:MAG: methionyl-tRNA formyltransferase [Treponemataceae bacterium]|nr:methionyl-tRNA formyltransferase [Treponemataceae bacterium]